MSRARLAALGLLFLAVLMGASECDPPSEPEKKNEQAERARRAAESITFVDNAEIDNIKERLQLTANPGLLGFVMLMNEAGQPILYEGVRGKITSGSKRLTDPKTVLRFAGAPAVTDAPSDEGTFGSSSEYIFYWNQQGAYRQWNGKYLYSDKPFRLRIEPLVISAEQK